MNINHNWQDMDQGIVSCSICNIVHDKFIGRYFYPGYTQGYSTDPGCVNIESQDEILFKKVKELLNYHGKLIVLTFDEYEIGCTRRIEIIKHITTPNVYARIISCHEEPSVKLCSHEDFKSESDLYNKLELIATDRNVQIFVPA